MAAAPPTAPLTLTVCCVGSEAAGARAAGPSAGPRGPGEDVAACHRAPGGRGPAAGEVGPRGTHTGGCSRCLPPLTSRSACRSPARLRSQRGGLREEVSTPRALWPPRVVFGREFWSQNVAPNHELPRQA